MYYYATFSIHPSLGQATSFSCIHIRRLNLRVKEYICAIYKLTRTAIRYCVSPIPSDFPSLSFSQS